MIHINGDRKESIFKVFGYHVHIQLNKIYNIIYGLHFKMQLTNLVNSCKSNIILLLSSFLFLVDMSDRNSFSSIIMYIMTLIFINFVISFDSISFTFLTKDETIVYFEIW